MAQPSATGAAAPPGAPALATLLALRRARDVLDRDYAQPLDVAALAAAAGYSPYHFVRIFRLAYGQTPGAYLRRRRIERAQRLLARPGARVTEVCHAVGFSSLGSFSAAFRRQTGVSPSRFQELRRRSGPLPVPACFLLMSAPGRPTPQS
ncbi:helix-turn-helix transcriptional regulator [Streptomonospora sp. PA3]|uniref:helix-turn-helix transcriptional regulator n=1 Tax=Streptomonospora sp. PA3 TaxID=2607326 RepID=UPI0012DEE570|nr:AraC family transcriptional regulator [Streptomonospora sp. PA3]MUL40583.1 helix-turn-helix transcriptional regulator [Streptomonospora sp. PA3]